MLYDLSKIDSNLEELRNTPLPPIDFTAVCALSSPASRASPQALYAGAVANADESLAAMYATRKRLDDLVRSAELWRATAVHSLLPVMSLPIEVLHMIFTFAIGTGFSSTSRLALSHVCRRWRMSCLALKHIWATVLIDGPKDLDKLAVFAARSRPLPLTLDVKAQGSAIPRWHLSKALEALKAVVADLFIDSMLSCPIGMGPLRNLQRFALQNPPQRWASKIEEPYILHLDTLPVALWVLDLRSPSISIPIRQGLFSHLAHVRLAFVTLRDVGNVLRSMDTPTLEYLEITRLKPEDTDDQSDQASVQNILINLHTLILTLVPIKFFEWFTAKFPLPTLKLLDVTWKMSLEYREARVELRRTRVTNAFRTLVSRRTLP